MLFIVKKIPRITKRVFNAIPDIPNVSLYDAKNTDIKKETAESKLSQATFFPIKLFLFLKKDSI